MKTKNLILLICFSIASPIYSVYGQCEGNQVELDAIKQSYESKFKLIEEDANELQKDAPNPNQIEGALNVDVEVTMKEQKFSLDLVSVTMKDKKIALDLPQITMEPKTIKFDEIYTIMVLKKTGQYPEMYCKDTWIYGPFGCCKTKGIPKCKVVWKDILTEIPEIRKKVVEIKTKLPVFALKTTEMITSIPEFKMVKQDIKMNLPSIVIKNISVESKKMEEKAENLKNNSQDLVTEQKKEFATSIAKSFKCQRDNLLMKRSEMVDSFSNSIKEIDLNIDQLQKNGFDSSNLKTSDNQTINLIDLKTMILEKEKNALSAIDVALEELVTKEKEVIDQYFVN